MLIKIDETLITGIKDIDIQHKLLFEAINSLEDQTNSKEQWFIVCNIQEYASVHFETEEEYMRSLGYPELAEHENEHRLFIKNYKEIKSGMEKEGVTEEFINQLRKFLLDWVTRHHFSIGVKAAKFIKENLLIKN